MKIKALVMDVDGTLTNGKVYMGESGELFKAFDIKDGYGINVILRQQGIEPVIITGRKSVMLENRCRELGIAHVYQGIHDKVEQLRKVAEGLEVSLCEIAYIGDDLNDMDCMKMCGMVGCPADAVDEIRELADYVCTRDGGNGAVREFIGAIVSGKIEVNYDGNSGGKRTL